MANFGQTLTVPFSTEPTTGFDAPPSFVSVVHTVQIGVIVGAVIGALAFISIVAAAILVWRRKTRRGRSSKTSSDATFEYTSTIPPAQIPDNDNNNNSLRPTPFILNPTQNTTAPTPDTNMTIPQYEQAGQAGSRLAQKVAFHHPPQGGSVLPSSNQGDNTRSIPTGSTTPHPNNPQPPSYYSFTE